MHGLHSFHLESQPAHSFQLESQSVHSFQLKSQSVAQLKPGLNGQDAEQSTRSQSCTSRAGPSLSIQVPEGCQCIENSALVFCPAANRVRLRLV